MIGVRCEKRRKGAPLGRRFSAVAPEEVALVADSLTLAIYAYRHTALLFSDVISPASYCDRPLPDRDAESARDIAIAWAACW
jgi:hypothetical protein